MLTCTDLVITIDWISAVDVEEVATIEGNDVYVNFLFYWTCLLFCSPRSDSSVWSAVAPVMMHFALVRIAAERTLYFQSPVIP